MDSWLNGWLFICELSGWGLESSYNYLFAYLMNNGLCKKYSNFTHKQKWVVIINYVKKYYVCMCWSFLKSQASDTSSDNKWQRVVHWVTLNRNEWQRVVISANFPFFRIREGPTTKHPKGDSLNLEEDLKEELLNYEQKQASKKKY